MKSMRDAFITSVAGALDDDPDLAVVLADISVRQFAALGAVERHPDRVINVGIREALAIGTAAGLALEGFAPIVHSYAPFLIERAFEQIKLDLVHQQLAATLVSIGASYDASSEGRTHQSPGDVALLGTLPDVRIELPGHPDEVRGALAAAREHRMSSYVRLSTASNRSAQPAGLTVVRPGRGATVLVIGPLLDEVLAATEDLDLRVLYTRTARPITDQLPAAVVADAPVAVVEPVLEGTSASAVAAVLAHRVPVYPIGVASDELRRYGQPREHAAAHGLDAKGLAARLRSWRTDLSRIRIQG